MQSFRLLPPCINTELCVGWGSVFRHTLFSDPNSKSFPPLLYYSIVMKTWSIMLQSWSKMEASCLEESSCKKWGSYSILLLSRTGRGFFLNSQIRGCISMWGICWGGGEVPYLNLLVERVGDSPDTWEEANLNLYHVNLSFLVLVKSFRICPVDFLLCQLSDNTCQVTERWWKCWMI